MESPLGSDLARLVRVWRALIDHRLKPLELTQTHWVTLHNIHQLPPEQSQIQLAKAIGIEQPSLVRTLDQLEEKGLISRQTCASDRRAKRIKLTEKAEPLINEMEEVIGKTRDEILSGVSKQEVETLLHLIRKLEQNILNLRLKINSLRPGLIRAFFTLPADARRSPGYVRYSLLHTWLRPRAERTLPLSRYCRRWYTPPC